MYFNCQPKGSDFGGINRVGESEEITAFHGELKVEIVIDDIYWESIEPAYLQRAVLSQTKAVPNSIAKQLRQEARKKVADFTTLLIDTDASAEINEMRINSMNLVILTFPEVA